MNECGPRACRSSADKIRREANMWKREDGSGRDGGRHWVFEPRGAGGTAQMNRVNGQLPAAADDGRISKVSATTSSRQEGVQRRVRVKFECGMKAGAGFHAR